MMLKIYNAIIFIFIIALFLFILTIYRTQEFDKNHEARIKQLEFQVESINKKFYIE